VITSLYRDPNGTITVGLDESALVSLLASGTGLLWVDLEHPSDEETAILSRVFHFHRLAIDDCLNEHVDPPKIDDYGDYLFVIVQGIQVDGQGDRLETTELDFFLGPSYVVSFHDAVFPSVTALRQRCQVESFPAIERGADFLAQQLVDGLVDDFIPEVEKLEELTDFLEEQVLTRPEPHLLERVLTVKRNTLRLRRTLLPQRDVINRLSRGEFPKFVRPETQIFYRDIYDHIVRVEELVETNRDLSESVLTTYLSVTSNRLNEVMKWLTIVSTLVLPPAAIAGIYGMNFEFMPELRWRYGYFFALALMATIDLVLLVYFRRRRWL
jgi:magnesium transporter